MENSYLSTNIRNIAVIAHVDHGKTTLVDFMLKQSDTFRQNEAEMTQTTIMDSNPLERERGITILAKNTAIFYKEHKINIIDTPGHADFSGEVERTLNMADGALLIIDAQEGPMPQTKFVLKKALGLGLKVIVVINKIDKQLADIPKTLEKTSDLFLELATESSQLDFPIFFAIGREGKAATTPEEVGESDSLKVILDAIIAEISSPPIVEGEFKLLVSALDYDTHKGKHIIGRIISGKASINQPLILLKENKEIQGRIEHMYVTLGLKKQLVQEAVAGDIVEITGFEAAEIGDTITDPSDKTPLPRLSIEEPTIKISFSANTSPFAGKEGQFSNSRQLLERLTKELETNVSLRLEVMDGGVFIVSGRGELHLSVLIETLRREGYEFQVGKPEVITKEIDGKQMEPVEELIVDVPDDFVGQITEEIGKRKGTMKNMETDGKGSTRLEYIITSKGMIGLRSILLTRTKGTAILNTMFDSYAPISPPLPKIRNGVLITSEGGVALTYGLQNAQERGTTFITAGTKVYEGMIIGLHARGEDIEINVTKEKKQTNMRSSGADMAIALTPPTAMSLEQCLDFLEEDELLEVTPENLRLRKKYLSRLDRVRSNR